MAVGMDRTMLDGAWDAHGMWGVRVRWSAWRDGWECGGESARVEN